jgi:CheY-like chemotaxis protein
MTECVTDGHEGLRGRRILVVEDEYLNAEFLAEVLEKAGATVVGPLGRAEEALDFTLHNLSAFDAAVLDINLHGKDSYAVAEVLAANGIGFVFATGYAASAIRPGFQNYPRCEKPFNAQALLDSLTQSLR